MHSGSTRENHFYIGFRIYLIDYLRIRAFTEQNDTDPRIAILIILARVKFVAGHDVT